MGDTEGAGARWQSLSWLPWGSWLLYLQLPPQHLWPPQTHCDPHVSPSQGIKSPSLLLLKPGVPLTSLPTFDHSSPSPLLALYCHFPYLSHCGHLENGLPAPTCSASCPHAAAWASWFMLEFQSQSFPGASNQGPVTWSWLPRKFCALVRAHSLWSQAWGWDPSHPAGSPCDPGAFLRQCLSFLICAMGMMTVVPS